MSDIITFEFVVSTPEIVFDGPAAVGTPGPPGGPGPPGPAATQHATLTDLATSGHPASIIAAAGPAGWVNAQEALDGLHALAVALDLALTTGDAAEAAARAALATALTAADEAETAARTAADTSEVSARNAAIAAAIATLVDGAPGLLDTLAELAAALGDNDNAIAVLTTAINARATQAALDTETAARIAGDTTEATARVAGDTAETSRATAAEGVLTAAVAASATTTALNAETARATAAEGALDTAIAGETTARAGADTTLTTGLAGEVTRATAAEATLTTNLATEVTRATTAEGLKATTTALGAETSRATTAEGVLTTAVNAEVTARAAAITALGTGYVPQGATYGTWYLDSYSGTDDARMAAALAAWEASPVGGTIILGARVHTFAQPWQPMAASMGAARYDQKYLRITGAGAGHNGVWADPIGGTLCDMTYAGAAPGKIDTRGTGTLELDHLSFRDTTGATVPFFHTTNTTPKIHDCAFQGSKTSGWNQDAIVCGGISTAIDGTDDAPFQGYGGFIRDCYFDKLRRGVYGRTYFNGFPIENNTWSTRCGATAAAAAIELLGISGSTCSGNAIRDNVIECVNYVYAVKADHAVCNTLGPNGFFDPAAPFLACYQLGDGGNFNTIIDGFRNDAKPLAVETPLSTGQNNITTGHQSQRSTLPYPQRFLGEVEFSPAGGGYNVDNGGNRGRLKVNGGTNPYPRLNISAVPGTLVADAVTTATLPTITSATAAFTAADQGAPISGTGIPAGSFILKRDSATQITINKNATITNTGVSITFGRLGATQDMTAFERHHIVGTGNAPSPAAGAAAGTGPTVSLTGTDLAGTITITTGTSPTTGILCTWNPAINFTSAATRYALTARNAAAATLLANGLWITHNAASTQINTVTVPVASTAHIFDYIAIQ